MRWRRREPEWIEPRTVEDLIREHAKNVDKIAALRRRIVILGWVQIGIATGAAVFNFNVWRTGGHWLWLVAAGVWGALAGLAYRRRARGIS